MWTTFINAIIGALKGIFGIKDKSAEPSIADLASKATTAQNTLQQEQSANDILQKGSAARADAAATIVHSTSTPIADPSTGTSVNEQLKREFPEDFRD